MASVDESVTSFPLVRIPARLVEVVGVPDEGTRVYRQLGSDAECGVWYDLLHEIDNKFVSPGGVAMFCGASRAAVHKRLREGKLTCSVATLWS